ncbi:MAG: YggS family pyridoxal phosphate-dependent enzyme [Ignavibacteriaceae bacterium]
MIAENLRLLQDNIEKKCRESGRDPAEVKLIAVSKNFGTDEINQAFNAGQRHFGENKAQELKSKFEKLGGKITWHFIGALQRNKVKYAVQSAEYIHSLDSLELAVEISKRAGSLGKVQKVLLQIKTSDEETKSGFESRDAVEETVLFCKDDKNLELVGLMTIAPYTDDENIIRQSFRQLRNLRDDLSQKSGIKIKELSMGMTGDYEIAIEEGATMLRIGSAIFGQRNYSKDWSVPV